MTPPRKRQRGHDASPEPSRPLFHPSTTIITSAPSSSLIVPDPRPPDALRAPAGKAAPLLGLPTELRLQIFDYLVVSDRPFMIGRHFEEKAEEAAARYAELLPKKRGRRRPGPSPARPDYTPHRPVQPAIARVCRSLREEALSLFYGENQFWLIHNEVCPLGEEQSVGRGTWVRRPRGFDPWLTQTAPGHFDWIRSVTLCCHSGGCCKMMLGLNLKTRELVRARRYSIYGDDQPFWDPHFLDRVRTDLAESRRDDLSNYDALMRLLLRYDSIFEIWRYPPASPPGPQRNRTVMTGLEYDW